MGTWGMAPWDNDVAADWYGDLFDETGLAAKVAETLQSDPEDNADEIRAAAALVILLGRVYMWPIDDLDDHLKLALGQLDKVKALYEEEGVDELVSAVEEEMALLRARLEGAPDASQGGDGTPASWGPFWTG